MLAIEPSATSAFLERLATRLPLPRAILVASAHFIAPTPVLTAAQRPRTLHDFSGFPESLYQIRYPAEGSPDLARHAAKALSAAGLEASVDADHGLDHGVWVPLLRMYPQADIPVVALSVNPLQSAEWHYRVGRALRPLCDEGVLVIGSGGFSHNLRALDWQHPNAPEFSWVTAFTSALREKLTEGALESALDWESLPEARRNHPTAEHLYPLYIAWGAGGESIAATPLHRAVEMGGMALDAFAFGTIV
jgi:4,5-DOPA dioxygenase extradiol